jgi:very-short-patch-repair endonuclease
MASQPKRKIATIEQDKPKGGKTKPKARKKRKDGNVSPQKVLHKVKTIKTKGQKRREVRAKKPEYGTSNLEIRFMHNFLDRLGVKYTYQFPMGTTKRFIDFKISGLPICIEVDGDYYHAYGLLYEEMNPMQKRNRKVDQYKDRWCLINGIRLIRIWEHDINKHPEKVMSLLKKELGIN